jgi:hypothetical protein
MAPSQMTGQRRCGLVTPCQGSRPGVRHRSFTFVHRVAQGWEVNRGPPPRLCPFAGVPSWFRRHSLWITRSWIWGRRGPVHPVRHPFTRLP